MNRIGININDDPTPTPRKTLMQALNRVDEIDKIVIIALNKDGETRHRYVCTGSAFMTNALLIDALQPGWDIPE